MLFIFANHGPDLAGSWTDDVWGPVQNEFGNLPRLASAVGVILIVVSIFKYLFDRRRSSGGGGGQTSGVMWSLALGAALATPGVIIPLFLEIFDAIVNAVIHIWDNGS